LICRLKLTCQLSFIATCQNLISDINFISSNMRGVRNGKHRKYVQREHVEWSRGDGPYAAGL
jgi:hypothetical protein